MKKKIMSVENSHRKLETSRKIKRKGNSLWLMLMISKVIMYTRRVASRKARLGNHINISYISNLMSWFFQFADVTGNPPSPKASAKLFHLCKSHPALRHQPRVCKLQLCT